MFPFGVLSKRVLIDLFFRGRQAIIRNELDIANTFADPQLRSTRVFAWLLVVETEVLDADAPDADSLVQHRQLRVFGVYRNLQL